MTTSFSASSEPFFSHLNVHKTPHVFLTAETDDFDENIIDAWQDEGFKTYYVPLGDGGPAYTKKIHSLADNIGVGENYAIVAFGDAATLVLEAYVKPQTPRICALVAYYPSAIPEPKTQFPPHIKVLVHLCGTSIGVRRNPEILGIQGKRRTVQKRLNPGLGLGGGMKLAFPSYTYEGLESGFAESDLEEYDGIAAELAWTRSLATVRRAFNIHSEMGMEKVRDLHLENTKTSSDAALSSLTTKSHVIHAPTLTGGLNEATLTRFYTEFFTPPLASLSTRLLSRTIGTDRIVDEMHVSFDHTESLPWILPGVPPTKKHVEVVVVSIVCIKGGKLAHEHVYWDQASVLVQVGLLDAKLVPKTFEGKVKRLPVVGAEAAKVLVGEKGRINELLGEGKQLPIR